MKTRIYATPAVKGLIVTVMLCNGDDVSFNMYCYTKHFTKSRYIDLTGHKIIYFMAKGVI